mgnify:CR=1 FL=1|tara:strand:+ start:1039 stop:2070 length:1032 start_codon:yes stop_codon:yes gene_type:complete
MKKGFITGVTGQDGSYLAELLLSKNYEVHGLMRKSSSFNTKRIEHLFSNKNFYTYYGDLSDFTGLSYLINKIKPDEIYNLAAQSHVKTSFEIPEYTANIDAMGALKFLSTLKNANLKTKFYQASTSELYGNVSNGLKNEETTFKPASPYAVAKLYAYWIVNNFRESYDMFACNGILFNHESPRRGETFVTRKITIGAAKIKLGIEKKMSLGNIDSSRDWGFAPEYVEGMWKILQKDKPDDFVLATGQTHTVKDFINESFKNLDIEILWEGNGLNQVGYNKANGEVIVDIDPKYFRPTDVNHLLGDSSKAKRLLNWEPKVKFEELVKIMVESDYNNIKKINESF